MAEIDTADLQAIEKLFAGLIFKMLLKEGMISEELVENMNSWKQSGFSVHSGSAIMAEDEDSRKGLSEYISRAPFSLERMSYSEDSDTVLYRGEYFHPGLARNFEVTDPLEWIARITAHIPKKGAKQIIYYGAYSQAWRGRERRKDILPKVLTEEKSSFLLFNMVIPNATTKATFNATDVNEDIVICENAEDMFDKLGI